MNYPFQNYLEPSLLPTLKKSRRGAQLLWPTAVALVLLTMILFRIGMAESEGLSVRPAQSQAPQFMSSAPSAPLLGKL